MTTLTLVLVIIVLAIVMWLVPMAEFFKKLIYVVALVCLLVWLLGIFGVVAPVGLR